MLLPGLDRMKIPIKFVKKQDIGSQLTVTFPRFHGNSNQMTFSFFTANNL
jgi:hypothetical protein